MLTGRRHYKTNFCWREQWAVSDWLVSWSKSRVPIGQLTHKSNYKWSGWQLLLKSSLSPSPAAFFHLCFSSHCHHSLMSQNLLCILIYWYKTLCWRHILYLLSSLPRILLRSDGNSAAGRSACGFTELMETPFTSLLCQNQPNKYPATRVWVPKRGPSPPPSSLPPHSPTPPLTLSLSSSQSNQSMQGWAAPFVSFCSSNWPPSGKLMTRALLEWLQWGTSRAAWWVRA